MRFAPAAIQLRRSDMKRAIIGLLIVGAVGAGAGAIYIRRGGPEVQVQTSPITRGDIVDTVGAHRDAAGGDDGAGRQPGVGQHLRCSAPTSIRSSRRVRSSRRLDPSLFDAQLQQARANLQSDARQPDQGAERSRADQGAADRRAAETTRARRSWPPKGLLPQSELDAAKIAVDTAQAGAGIAGGDGQPDAGGGHASRRRRSTRTRSTSITRSSRRRSTAS